MKIAIIFLLFLVLTTRYSQALAQNPGCLDLSFDPGTGTNSLIYTIAVQDDGKIIVGGGFTSYNGTTKYRIARLNADGSLDATFNPNDGTNYWVRTTAVQSDGRILIGGAFTSFDGTSRNRIARLNADGSLDTSFDPGQGANHYVYSIAIQSDGRIVIAGSFTSYDGTPRNRLARLNPNGSLDATFDPGAVAAYPEAYVHSIDIQSDGKLIVGGGFINITGTSWAQIARLNVNGSVDETFNPGEGASSDIYNVEIQSDGRVLIAGSFSHYNGTPRRKIALLNQDGSLDETFDPGLGADNHVHAAAILSDGRFFIGGHFTSYNSAPRNGVARLNADGSLDTSFDPGAGAIGGAYSVFTTALQSDGRIIIGGDFTSYDGTLRNNIARLNCEGTIEVSDASIDGFAVFPNPANSSITIVAPSQPDYNRLVLRNMLGQEVLRYSLSMGSNEVSVSGLASGIYSMQLGESTVRRTQSLMVQ